MNHVERFRAVMDFQGFDRLPRIEWATWWSKTLQRWQAEGLPTVDRFETDRHFGLDPYYQQRFAGRVTPFPRQVPHGQGLISSLDEYESLRPLLYPSPESQGKQMELLGAAQQIGKAVVWATLDGFFWFPRVLLGIERHLYAFYDQPELMHRINQDLADYNVMLAQWLSGICAPTFITLAEDMSYNHGPMISREQFYEFIAPYYRQVVPALHEIGTMVIIDSDGDVEELMPWLMDVGVDGVLPLERQAGCDLARLRAALPEVRMIGHFDKMVMTRGEAALREEFERLLRVMRSGGYIPSVDHQTPPGVSLEQYRCYLRLLFEYTELAAR